MFRSLSLLAILVNVRLLVPIAERVMPEQNDPLLNDAQESVPEETVQALRELGAFGLQVN